MCIMYKYNIIVYNYRFWRDLGKHMSKLHPGQSTVHLMESNMAGNRQGESVSTLFTPNCCVLYTGPITSIDYLTVTALITCTLRFIRTTCLYVKTSAGEFPTKY